MKAKREDKVSCCRISHGSPNHVTEVIPEIGRYKDPRNPKKEKKQLNQQTKNEEGQTD